MSDHAKEAIFEFLEGAAQGAFLSWLILIGRIALDQPSKVDAAILVTLWWPIISAVAWRVFGKLRSDAYWRQMGGRPE